MFITGVWSTRDTADDGVSAKQTVRTTLRELIVYIVFLAVLTVGKLCTIEQEYNYLTLKILGITKYIKTYIKKKVILFFQVDYNHTYEAFRSLCYNESSFESIPS